MSGYLAIAIRFLSDRYHGRVDNGRSAEWPPSPLRVFQAVLAGAAPRWVDARICDAESGAFRWLERQGPPMILAPRAHPGRPLLTYVRENLSDVAPEKRDAKIHRPTLMEGEPRVVYAWPLNGEPEDRISAATMARCARHVRALGWGIDMAVGDGAIVEALNNDESPVVRWIATQEPRERQLRVAVDGTLNDLLRRHGASLNRIAVDGRNPLAPLTAYSVVGYCRTTQIPMREFAAFALRPSIDPAIAEQDTPEGHDERRKVDRYRSFRNVNSAKVAAMLRHATCKTAKAPGGWPFEEDSARYVAGHGEDGKRRSAADRSARFSYLPLPSVGTHADGMIRRVVVAEPWGGDGSHAAWAAQRLSGLDLIDEDTGTPVATLHRLDPQDVPVAFTGPSREWATATPIVLPGFDGLKMEKAARLLSRACDQAGLPEGSVEGFEFIGPSAKSDGRFFVPNYLRAWPLRWAVIRFKEEVRGPIAIGAGRHCGLGVLSSTVPRALRR